MLERLTVDAFAGRVGEPFRIVVDDASVLDAELTEATALGAPAAARGGRAPFSLVFRVGSGDVVPQGIYRLEHDALGALDLFIVPIGPDADGMRYEAVFA